MLPAATVAGVDGVGERISPILAAAEQARMMPADVRFVHALLELLLNPFWVRQAAQLRAGFMALEYGPGGRALRWKAGKRYPLFGQVM